MRQHTIVSVCLRINTPARESTEGGGEGIKTRCVPVRLGSCRIRRSATRHHVRNDLAAYFFHQTAFDSVPGQRVTEAFAVERLKSIQLDDARSAEMRVCFPRRRQPGHPAGYG